jgi:hypothetical protein
MKTSIPNCLEVVTGLDEAMEGVLPPDDQRYFVVGGIATRALEHPETYIEHDTQTVFAHRTADKPVLRDDGSRVDIDIVIPRILTPEEALEIKHVTEVAVENELLVSIFGLLAHRPVRGGFDRAKRTAAAWTSDRTLAEDGKLRLELFPLTAEIPDTVFEPWRMHTMDTDLSIMNPAAHALNYATRSISGLRPKDSTKVARMMRRVAAETPFAERMLHGDYRPLLGFAAAIDAVREGRLSEDDPYVDESASALDLQIAHYKSAGLHGVERHEKLVSFALKGPMQRLLNFGIGAA